MAGRSRLGALTLFMILASGSGFAAGTLTGHEAVGIVMMNGSDSVLINAAPMISGTTVFKGDVIQTSTGSVAVVKLRSGATVMMSEGSELALERTDTFDGLNLRQGAISLRKDGLQPEQVTVLGASVLVRAENGFPALCRIAALQRKAAVFNDRGHVEIRGGGAPVILPTGKHATLDAGSPQAGTQAGKVSNELPAETVQRSGKTTQAPLNVEDPVYFNDVVFTQNTGRVRIALLDGSFLNIGPRSQMHITKQDTETQQTEVELTAGKIRGEVVKLTKPKASFEVKTPTAVIGVVGTHFVVESDNNSNAKKRRTRVWCIEGLVRVRNIDPAVLGEILLHAGEFTVIGAGLPPAPAIHVENNQLEAQQNDTDASGAGGAAGAGAPGSFGNFGNFVSIGAIGASAGAAAGAGVAMGHFDTASNLFNQAGTTLDSANSASSTAVGSANAASAAAANTVTLLGGLDQTFASPTYPCGCH